jgi:hypothetical protein
MTGALSLLLRSTVVSEVTSRSIAPEHIHTLCRLLEKLGESQETIAQVASLVRREWDTMATLANLSIDPALYNRSKNAVFACLGRYGYPLPVHVVVSWNLELLRVGVCDPEVHIRRIAASWSTSGGQFQREHMAKLPMAISGKATDRAFVRMSWSASIEDIPLF